MIGSNKECDDLCAMLSECNLVGNPREWWMDFGATRHVCANKELFSSFALAQVEEMIYLANSATAKLRRNLISVSLLDKNGFKCAIVSEKIVISKGEVYVGKGYLTDGLYKMNGHLAKVQVPTPKRVKIGPKTVYCAFIGYAKSSKACWFLVYKFEHLDINENMVIESDNTEFFENVYPYKTRHEQSSGGSKRPLDEPSENVHNEENPRCSTRQRTSTSFGSNFVTFFLENEPQTLKEAMLSLDSSFWKEAVNSKIDSILSKHMWELVDFLSGNKPLGSK
ncbi:hypothetical protein FXO37_27606 [Capsicum annuum]|nr:hypothetical protein FXO37_27606 [Capsicum annuum]